MGSVSYFLFVVHDESSRWSLRAFGFYFDPIIVSIDGPTFSGLDRLFIGSFTIYFHFY